MTALLTGASGFVGAAVLSAANKHGLSIRPVFRSAFSAQQFTGAEQASVVVPTLEADSDWSVALSGVSVVIHCAARAHVMRDTAADPLEAYRVVNVEGTLNLARQASVFGVKRFVFISSIKVNGESTKLGCAYTSADVPAPEDAYGKSKAEAEAGLRLLSQETGMEVVIIRPPLVYGPGVKGNFKSLINLVAYGLPLPFGCVPDNRRSLVVLDNLVDLILVCVNHSAAANQTFLVSDGEDLSTAELLRRIGKALKRPACLLNVPASWLVFVARLLSKEALAQRLLGSLQVDISYTCKTLGWKPPINVDEGLRRTAHGLRE